jgi:O-antigen/teichoic acid export membrane protein
MGRIEIFKNVSSSWFSLGINILVGIFLSPFILHRLGDTAYGIWILIFSVTGYYGLFDLGIRSSVVRYVSTYTATNDQEGLAKLINTSLATYTGIGVLAMIVTLACSVFVDRIFRIPAEFLSTARLLFLMVGTAVALGFPTGIFGGILEGLQRFYFVNLTNVISTLLRAALIVVVLQRGYGLLTVALITVVLPLLSSLARAAIALRVLPVRFGWRYVDRTAFREIANYSAVSFILMIGYKLRYKTDEIVIGTFLSVTAITYFSIGDRLLDYAAELVGSLAQIFVPMVGQSHAKGDTNRLRKIWIAGNRACAMIIFPITAVLIILGKSIITAWVGAKYVAQSYPVLVVLAVPMMFTLAQGASVRTLYGMAKHRSLAIVTLMESVSNLILSIILIRPFGIVGDAFGTAIPLLCTSFLFMPRHMCRLLGVRIGTYLREAYTLPVVLTLPLVATLLLMRRWFEARTVLEVALQTVIAFLPYGLGLLWAMRRKRVWEVGDVSSAPLDEVAVAFVETSQQEP